MFAPRFVRTSVRTCLNGIQGVARVFRLQPVHWIRKGMSPTSFLGPRTLRGLVLFDFSRWLSRVPSPTSSTPLRPIPWYTPLRRVNLVTWKGVRNARRVCVWVDGGDCLQSILFLCTHNSARSHLGEALLRHLAGDRVEVYSAGTEGLAIADLVGYLRSTTGGMESS